MKEYWQKALDWFALRNMREKVILLIAALGITFVIWNLLLQLPLNATNNQTRYDIRKTRTHNNELKAQIAQLTVKIAAKKASPILKEHLSLTNQVALLDRRAYGFANGPS